MFAIIETGGKQYKVKKGQTLDIERIEEKEGETFNFDKVLLISDSTATKIGTPLVEGAYAIAKIISHQRGDKVLVFKMKPKKRYRKTQGHRQEITTVEITDIKASGGSAPAKKVAPSAATEEAKEEKAPTKTVKKAPTKTKSTKPKKEEA